MEPVAYTHLDVYKRQGLMLNFFRAIPEELEEAAFMDGANHWNILARIYIPLSKASIATVSYTHLDVYKRQPVVY